MSNDGPYRDDRDTLRAENERLRAELKHAKKTPRLLPAVGFFAAHVALRFGLESHLNASSDASFGVAAVVTYLPLAVGFALVIRAVLFTRE